MRWMWLGALALIGCKDSDADGTRDKKDCAPDDFRINPEAQEVCDGIDNNCNGQIDEDVTLTAYWDRDLDGYGDPAYARRVCTLPDDGTIEAGDCNDVDPNAYPGATEICNFQDDDCDGIADEDVLITFYRDDDGDGHGVSSETTEGCTVQQGFSATDDDCNDAEPLAWTGAVETCDGIDNDCDLSVDEDLEPTRQWEDADGDGYGNPDAPILACGPGIGVSDNALDCNDNDATESPDTIEGRGDSIDNDCDGYVDEFGVGPGNEFATVNDAMASAPSGSVIQLDQGFHLATVDLTSKTFTFAGEGCERTTLYADALGTAITADDDTIERLTVSGGTGTVLDIEEGDQYGGGLLLLGDTTVNDLCVVANNADYGGGIAVIAGTLTANRLTLATNTSGLEGAGMYLGVGATGNVWASSVLGNVSSDYGGGFASFGATLTVTNSVIAGNQCSLRGCGAYAIDVTDDLDVQTTATATFDQVTFHANTSDPSRTGTKNGEAIYHDNGSLFVSNSLFTGHAQPYVVIETLDAVITKSYLGYRGNSGPDADYESFQQDRIADNVRYVLDDPALPPAQWDLHLLETSGFLDAGDPARLDPDGSPAQLGAYGGDSAPEGWNLGLALDEDGDGLLDGWEIRYGTNLFLDDSADDDDGDGLTHAEEASYQSDPLETDTDLDGVLDGVEAGIGSDPTAPQDQAPFIGGVTLRYTLVGESAPLSIASSFDPNGDPLTYDWSVRLAPPTSTATPLDPASQETTFVPDLPGTYFLDATADDGSTTRTLEVTLIALSGSIVPDDYPTVQEAIDAGQTTIGIRPGVITGAIASDGDLSLVGLGAAEDVILDAGGAGSVIAIDGADLIVAHLTIRGGYAQFGGGLHAQDSLSIFLSDVTLSDNYAFEGGGLWISGEDTETVLRDVRVIDNIAEEEGGGLWILGEDTAQTLYVERGWFAGNRAVEGGAMWLDGGIQTGDADFFVHSSVFLDNEATIGSAWRHTGQGSDINLWNSTLANNRGESLAWSDEGRNIVLSDVLSRNEVTLLWDGSGVEWQHFDGVWEDPTEPAFYDPLAPVSLITTHVVADPLIGSLTNDGDPLDDIIGFRAGTPTTDLGFIDHIDGDTSRADIGSCGGPHAAPSCVRFSSDVDADGLSDGWEIAFGLDPTVDDAGDDADGDTLDNAAEHTLGTRPDRADTDQDGVDDATESGNADDPRDDRAHRPVALVTGPGELKPVRVEIGEIITLDASASYDPDDPLNNPVTFQWHIVGKAPGSALDDSDLIGADLAQVAFSPDRSGAFRISVTVDDGTAISRERVVWITVPKEIAVPGDYATIDEAVAEASPGDIIRLGPGNWPVTFNPEALPLTIAGAGIGQTILEPSGDVPVFQVDADGELGIRDLTISGGIAYLGAGVRCEGGILTMERVLVERGVAYNGAGLYGYSCTATLIDTSFEHNHSAWSGGAVYVLLGSLDWTGGSASFNTSGYTGGALVLYSVDATLRNLHIHRNQAENVGAAILVEYSGTATQGALDARHLTISGNRGLLGTIYRADGMPVRLTYSSIVDNSQYGFYDAYTLHTGLTLDHNNWFLNTVNSNPISQSLGATDLRVNPRYVAYDVLALVPDDIHLTDDSPLRDAGTDLVDPDGSLEDYGSYGGALAPPDWDIYFRDSEGDGMADGWEQTVGLDPDLDDAALDPDLDTLSNLIEFGYKSDPFVVDSDADGVSDTAEAGVTNPANESDYAPSANGGVDQINIIGAPVQFTGTGTDPQLDPVSFSWTLYTKPASSALTTADLTGADTATVGITPDHAGQFVLQLVTSDGAGYSKPDFVILRVRGDLTVPGDYPTLAQAVKAAESGAIITIDAGVYPALLDLDGKDLTFIGAGRDATVLDGEGQHLIIKAVDGEIVELQDLTLSGGRGGRGGALWMDDGAVLTATSVSFTDNTAAEGGAFFSETSTFEGTDVRLVDNRAGYRGGAANITSNSTIDLLHTLLAGNEAQNSQGGALRFVTGTFIGSNLIFSDNEAYEGGALYMTSSVTATLDHVTATYNLGDYYGAFARVGDSCTLDMTDSIIAHNRDAAAISETSTADPMILTYSLIALNDIDFSLVNTPVLADGVDGNDLDGTPDLLGLTDDSDWTNDDWTLGPASSAIDVGDPLGTLDPDGSAPDMGAFGGVEGSWSP